MPTIPTTGKKKTITKKEVKELYYNLNQTFDLIGKKTNGESWEQLKNCYTSCNLIDVLSDLIKNNFFDLFSYDGAINQMDDRQKDALLKGAVNFQAVARKIAEKAPLIVKSVFNETFFSHDEIINYNFPAKFLIPKDQFNYVLKTGKRWVDRKPNAEYGGMIISKSHTYFQFVETRLPMMLVGDNPNLVGYFELLSIFKEKFKAEEWEIDIWLFFVQPKELAALKNNDIDSSGYVYLYQKPAGSNDYTTTFYHKEQLEKFNPEERFFEYQTLLKSWQARFGFDEEKILKLISNYLSFLETQKIIPSERFIADFSSITAPIHKRSYEQFHYGLSKKPSFEEKVAFIKGAVFGSSYIKAIEEKHQLPVLLSQQNKQLEVEEKKIEDIDIQQTPVGTNLNLIILKTFKSLTASSRKPSTIDVLNDIKKNQSNHSSVIVSIKGREIEWKVSDTEDTKIMKYKTLQNLVSSFRTARKK